MKGQKLNKQELSNEMQVDKRTIQRDIDDIRSHFFDSEEYGGQRLEITYSHLDNSYFLNDDDARQNDHLFKMLLILIRTTTPVLNKELHQLLETLIFTHYKKDSKDLARVLSSFTVNEAPLPIENIQNVIQSIEQSNSLYHHENQIEVDPLSLGYKLDTFIMQANEGNKAYEYNLHDNTFTPTGISSRNKVQSITFEIENSLWDRLKNIVSLLSLESRTQTSVIVTLKMNVNDALTLCYTQAPSVRLIEPTSIRDMITDKLMAMIKMYAVQSTNIKECR